MGCPRASLRVRCRTEEDEGVVANRVRGGVGAASGGDESRCTRVFASFGPRL